MISRLVGAGIIRAMAAPALPAKKGFSQATAGENLALAQSLAAQKKFGLLFRHALACDYPGSDANVNDQILDLCVGT